MKTIRSNSRALRQLGGLARRQRGSALVLTLVTGSVIAIALTAYLTIVQYQNRAVLRAEAWNYEIPMAEAGIEEALTQLYCNRTNLATNGWTLVNNAYVKGRTLPHGRYVVAITNAFPPVVYSQGYAQAPDKTNYLSTARTLRVTTASLGLFRKGMVAKGQIDLTGNNLYSDSFDSTDPAHSTNGRYDPTKSKDNGDIATNECLTNSIMIGNANIFGHASTGPGGSVSVGPNGGVGSRLWQNSGNHGFQPGAVADDMNVSFPDVEAPFTSGGAPSSGDVGGTNYAFVFGNGNYVVSSLDLSGQNAVCVNGNATVLVTGDLKLAGQAFIYISTNCTLNLYVGGTADIAGNGLGNANASATNFFYWGLNSNTSLGLRGNAAFTGLIYAPYAAFTLGGGGNNPYDFVGASVTGSVRLNGHYSFHYDESLANLNNNGAFVVTSWDEL
jgi:hypothetical protein